MVPTLSCRSAAAPPTTGSNARAGRRSHDGRRARRTVPPMTQRAEAEPSTEGPAAPFLEPRDGVPAPLVTVPELERAVAAFVAGTGPVAIDAERASGYRYSARAYLVQLRRAGAGTALVDPIAVPDLTSFGAALADTEW